MDAGANGAVVGGVTGGPTAGHGSEFPGEATQQRWLPNEPSKQKRKIGAMSVGWLYLILAGVFEIVFTTSMRYLDWPPRPGPLAVFLAASVLSFALLVAAIKTVPLGTAYAVWTGIGAAGTAAIGIWFYGEPATAVRLVLLGLLIGSIVGLKLAAG